MSRTNWQDWFSYSKRERNGIIILILLIIALILIQLLMPMPNLSPKTASIEFTPTEQSWLAEKEAEIYSSETKQSPREIQYFNFDPNKASISEFEQLGLATYQAKMIENYRKKGGQFQCKEDLLKIFSIKEEQYELLSDYITLPSKNELPKKESYSLNKYTSAQDSFQYNSHQLALRKKEDDREIFDLNSIDSASLESLNGIGPYLAGKIISYRERLGGFHSKAQLLEVWKMDEEKLTGIDSRLIIDYNSIRKININKVGLEELKKHPYLKWNQAKTIIAYRDQHGPYLKPEDIMKTRLIDENTFQKLLPYITIE